jgi:hypothetical protein
MSIAKETLENRVDRLLVSPAVLAPLKARGLVLKEISSQKARAVEAEAERLVVEARDKQAAAERDAGLLVAPDCVERE